MPVTWELEVRMATVCLAFIYYLKWQEFPQHGATINSSYLSFVIDTADLYSFTSKFVHCPRSCWNQVDSCLESTQEGFPPSSQHSQFRLKIVL